MKQPTTALLPLKAHSERIKSKNIRPLCGKPLYHWIILTLLESKYITQILIDTDSEEIASDARKHFPVTVIMRPESLRGDMIGINPLIDFEITMTENNFFLQTHSTNPLVNVSTIDHAFNKFFDQIEQTNTDSLFSVTELHTRLYDQKGNPINHDPQNMLRTQDLPPIFEENSNFYIFSRESFKRNNHRIGQNPILFPVRKLEAIDIDYEEDFILAETLMKLRLDGKF